MDPTRLGASLRTARKNRGLTQVDAARALALPRTALVKIEAGERSLSTLELTRLASLYSRSVAQLTSSEPDADDDALEALQLLDPRLEKEPGVQAELLHALSLYREGVSLERLLGRRDRAGPPAYSFPAPTSAIEAVLQGNDLAGEERERLGLGKAAIRDVAELVSGEGIWASGLSLPDEMSGFFLRHPSIGMAIAVNSSHSRERKRFSYAHEYAHALLDRDQGASVSTRENSRDLCEKRANAFAAAFLMPREGVRFQLHRLHKGRPRRLDEPLYSVADDSGISLKGRPRNSQDLTCQEVAHLAHHFGVSYQAAVYRLLNLGEIRRSGCEDLLQGKNVESAYLYLRMLAELDSRDDGGAPHRELVKQVYLLAVEAYRREEISGGRLRDLARRLGRDSRELLGFAKAVRSG